jgi:hypothetical protein
MEAVDMAESAGIRQDILSWGAPVADVDGDGHSDFILVRHLTAPDSLYLNDGHGGFTEVTPPSFPTVDRHWCSFGDVDGDGLTDVYCALGADRGTGSKVNELWIRQPGEPPTFIDAAESFGVTDPVGRGRYNALVDVNGDGRLDLFLSNAAPRVDGQPSPNRLFINVDGTHFRDAPEYGLDVETGSHCLITADIDHDGFVDILLCGSHKMLLYHNEGGHRFVEVGETKGLLPVPAGVSTDATPPDANPYWHNAVLADVNLDGRLDVVGAAFDKVVIQYGTDDGFTVPTEIVKTDRAWRVATGDVNGDHRPDFYVLQTCDKLGRSGSNSPKEFPDFIAISSSDPNVWRQVPVPVAARGCGDSVDPIDVKGNGTTEFIVLNGRDNVAGPAQLIEVRPTGGK